MHLNLESYFSLTLNVEEINITESLSCILFKITIIISATLKEKVR